MNRLDIDNINDRAPYDVAYDDDGEIIFLTDNGISYSVTFDDDSNPYYAAYWFNLTNLNNISSPSDKKIAQTVICIIEEFFRQNPDILLYMCSTDGGQQAQRSRLFFRWFNGAEQQKHYYIRATEIKGEDGIDYVACIVQRNNPHLGEIIELFDSDITMFNEMKP